MPVEQVARDQRPHRDPGRREPHRRQRVLHGRLAAARTGRRSRCRPGTGTTRCRTAGSRGRSRSRTAARSTTVTEFGMLAKIGVNDRGVGVMLNMLHHRNDIEAAEARRGRPPGAPAGPGDPRRRRLGGPGGRARVGTGDLGVHVADGRRRPGQRRVRRAVPGRARHRHTHRGAAGAHQPLRLRGRRGRLPGQHDRRRAPGCGASTCSRCSATSRPSTAQDVLDAMTHHLPDGGVCRHPITGNDPVLWHRTLGHRGHRRREPPPRRARGRPVRRAPARSVESGARVRQPWRGLRASCSSGDIACSQVHP